MCVEIPSFRYAGIDGVAPFLKASFEFAYGSAKQGSESVALAEGRIGGVQAISGTGALRLGGELLARFRGQGSAIYLPGPSWANHVPIFKDSGLDVKSYTYYDPATCGLNLPGMLADVAAAPAGSVFLLHACAHNPTGVDPTSDQWGEISKAMKAKSHVAFFDSAYQGFASGDAEKDATAVRQFVDDGHHILLAQSYSKNFGLYGERVGALSAVTASPQETAAVVSQMKILVRTFGNTKTLKDLNSHLSQLPLSYFSFCFLFPLLWLNVTYVIFALQCSFDSALFVARIPSTVVCLLFVLDITPSIAFIFPSLFVNWLPLSIRCGPCTRTHPCTGLGWWPTSSTTLPCTSSGKGTARAWPTAFSPCAPNWSPRSKTRAPKRTGSTSPTKSACFATRA